MIKESISVVLPEEEKYTANSLSAPEEGGNINFGEKPEGADSDKAEKDPARDKLLNFLINSGALQPKEGFYIFDSAKFNDPAFTSEELRKLSLGQNNGKRIFGSKKLIYDKLADLDIVTQKDYQNSSEAGEEVKLKKLFNRKDKDFIQERILKILGKHKVLEKIDGFNVFDMEKFLHSDFISEKLINKHGKSEERVLTGITRQTAFEKLADLKIISKSDYEQQKITGGVEEKYLLNRPENIDDAFDIKKYANDHQKYYLNYWDLYNHNKKKNINWDYKIKAKNGEEINAAEFALAVGIYKDFHGERDEKGNLLVWDDSKNKLVKITVEWIKENLGTFGGTAKKTSIDSPHKFLLDKCPDLLKKGLLRLDDFNIKTSDGQSGKLLRKEFTVNEKSPYVAINGIRYYVGKDFFKFGNEKISTENLKVIVLDSKTAGIFKSFKGKDDLIFTIDLLNNNEKEEKRQQVEKNYGRKLSIEEISARTIIGKRELKERIFPWSATKDNPQRNDEAPEEYAERIRRVGDWGFIKQVSDEFTKECQIGIHNLSWREQQWLASAAYELGNNYPKLVEFGKKYGQEGLKAFLSCEQDIKNAEKILEFNESLNETPEAAKSLFAEYALLVDGAEKSTEEIGKLYDEIFYEKQIDKQNVRQGILKRGSRLLVEASGELSGKNLTEENKNTIIINLIQELRKESDTRDKLFKELKSIALELNKKYKKTENDLILKKERGEIAEYIYFLDPNDSKKLDDFSGIDNFWKEQIVINEFEKFKKQEKVKYDEKKISDMISIFKRSMNSANSFSEISNEAERLGLDWRTQQEKVRESVLKKKHQIYAPVIKDLESLLQLQKILERKFDEIAGGDFHAETDNKLLRRYNEIKNSAENLSEYIYDNFETAKHYLNAGEIAEELLKESIDIISAPTASPEARKEAIKKLEKKSASLLLLEKIFKQLPKEEIAELDLKKMPVIERMEDVKAAGLGQNKNLAEQMKKIIEAQFPEGDGEVFLKECSQNQNLKFTVALADKKILSFFAKEKISDNIEYIDWFISNPDTPIKGLGEATLRLGFDGEEEKNQAYCAVAKPHAKSFQILVEKLGFAAFGGSTEDGEYKHHYARVRKFPSDAKFKSKNIPEESAKSFKRDLSYICAEPNDMQSLVYEGKILSACKIAYHGQSYRDDIKKEDPDGWIMKQIEEQYKKGFVLTRFMPENSEKENQTFYAVFEKEKDGEPLAEELENVISRKKRVIPTPTQKRLAEAE